MRLLARLRDRWDLDAGAQASLPFDRAIATVSLRRAEIACLLALVSDAAVARFGTGMSATLVAMPLAIVAALLSRPLARSANLRLQQAAVIVMVVLRLADVIWGVADMGRRGLPSSGYMVNLLSLTLLFVLPPRTLALIAGAGLIAFCAVVLGLPLPNGTKIAMIVNVAIVSGIALIAGWLIYSARRSDHEQRGIIRAQTAQLTEEYHRRDQLMAITAHDLRSPLYGLRNLLDLAARRAEADGTPQIAPMRDALFGIEGMIGLVSRLLDAHSAEHEPLTARVRQDIRGHLLAAARRVAPAGEAAGVAVDVDLPPRPVAASFDENALNRILDNLLSNAIRFSPRGAPVRLRCATSDGAAIIEVEDAGPGFDAAGRAAMFTKFHLRPGARLQAKSGTGMGLFIAASFADRMGASLSFHPVEPTGARFSLRIAAAD